MKVEYFFVVVTRNITFTNKEKVDTSKVPKTIKKILYFSKFLSAILQMKSFILPLLMIKIVYLVFDFDL